MVERILDYPSEPRPRPRRTRWGVLLLLVLLTPFVLFALVVALMALGFFGGPGD